MSRRVANGPEIRRIRELACITQQDLAGQIGIRAPSLWQIETGGGMHPRNIKRAAAALGVPVTAITVMVHTPAEVCAALHINGRRLKKLTDAGELVIVAGGITEDSLEEYIARRLPEMEPAS